MVRIFVSKKVVALYFYATDNFFCEKMRKNLFIHVLRCLMTSIDNRKFSDDCIKENYRISREKKKAFSRLQIKDDQLVLKQQ